MEQPKFIMLCPARGLEQSRGDATELHMLVSEEKSWDVQYTQQFICDTLKQGDKVNFNALFIGYWHKLTSVENMYILQGSYCTASSTD